LRGRQIYLSGILLGLFGHPAAGGVAIKKKKNLAAPRDLKIPFKIAASCSEVIAYNHPGFSRGAIMAAELILLPLR